MSAGLRRENAPYRGGAARNGRRPERELRGALPAAQCNQFERIFGGLKDWPALKSKLIARQGQPNDYIATPIRPCARVENSS